MLSPGVSLDKSYFYYSRGQKSARADAFLPSKLKVGKVLESQLLVLDDNELKCKAILPENLQRNYSRQVLWMFEGLEELQLRQKLNSYNPYRVGIYLAGRGYMFPWEVMQARKNEKLSKSKAMRFNFRPLHNLKYNLGIAPGHLSIQYGIHGPTSAFIESRFAPLNAYKKAKIDLNLRSVDLAIVIAVNIFEEILHVVKNKLFLKEYGNSNFDSCIYAESIACQLMTRERHEVPVINDSNDVFLGYLECLRKENSLGFQIEK